MLYSNDEEHSPNFTILEKQMLYVSRRTDNAEQNNNKNSHKKCFLVFSTKSEQFVIQQSHIINLLLTSFARFVRQSIAFGFYRTDLAPSSLALYKKP